MEKLKSLWKKFLEILFGKKEIETEKVAIKAPTTTFTPSPSTIVLPAEEVNKPTITFTSPEPVKTIVVTNPVATIKFTEIDNTVKKEPVKKAPAKKAPTKKAPVKKAPAKKAPAKKAPVKKSNKKK